MPQDDVPVWSLGGRPDGSAALSTSFPPPTGPPVQGVPAPPGYSAPHGYPQPYAGTSPSGLPMAPPLAYQPPVPPVPVGPGYLRKTNTFAVLSLIFGILGGIVLGVVFGHVALSQIRRTGEQGRGMAITGLVLSYCWIVPVALLIISGEL